MSNVYINSAGFTKTQVNNDINATTWNANYDGNSAKLSMNINDNGSKEHIEMRMNNQDLMKLFNIPTIQGPLDERLHQTYLAKREIPQPIIYIANANTKKTSSSPEEDYESFLPVESETMIPEESETMIPEKLESIIPEIPESEEEVERNNYPTSSTEVVNPYLPQQTYVFSNPSPSLTISNASSSSLNPSEDLVIPSKDIPKTFTRMQNGGGKKKKKTKKRNTKRKRKTIRKISAFLRRLKFNN
jgi:hypothetical protein